MNGYLVLAFSFSQDTLILGDERGRLSTRVENEKVFINLNQQDYIESGVPVDSTFNHISGGA